MTVINIALYILCCRVEKQIHDAIVKNICSLAFVLGKDWLETTQMTWTPTLFLTWIVISMYAIVIGKHLLKALTQSCWFFKKSVAYVSSKTIYISPCILWAEFPLLAQAFWHLADVVCQCSRNVEYWSWTFCVLVSWSNFMQFTLLF